MPSPSAVARHALVLVTLACADSPGRERAPAPAGVDTASGGGGRGGGGAASETGGRTFAPDAGQRADERPSEATAQPRDSGSSSAPGPAVTRDTTSGPTGDTRAAGADAARTNDAAVPVGRDAASAADTRAVVRPDGSGTLALFGSNPVQPVAGQKVCPHWQGQKAPEPTYLPRCPHRHSDPLSYTCEEFCGCSAEICAVYTGMNNAHVAGVFQTAGECLGACQTIRAMGSSAYQEAVGPSTTRPTASTAPSRSSINSSWCASSPPRLVHHSPEWYERRRGSAHASPGARARRDPQSRRRGRAHAMPARSA